MNLAPYRRAAGQGVLTLPRCPDCGTWQWPPRAACLRCGGRPEWRPASGRGRIAAWSKVTRAPRPEWQDQVPYAIAFVDLDEGVRLFTRIVGPGSGTLRAGLPVRCRFEASSDPALQVPVFVVAED